MTLISLLSQILGEYNQLGKGEHYFFCPFCHHHNKKFAVNLIKNKWKCWICGAKGGSLIGLFKRLDVTPAQLKELRTYISDTDIKSFKEDISENVVLNLPNEFLPLWKPANTFEYKNAINYLKKRNITQTDIIRYRMGYCTSGNYSGRIIIPSYNSDGKLNYFIARLYYDGGMKYKNPPISKNVIMFEEQINWNLPIVLCEGVFDAIAIRRNAIPMLGKFLPKALEQKIIASGVKTIYVLLDEDARKEALELEHKLKSHGISVSQVFVNNGDASDLGFEKTWNYISHARETTFKDFIHSKLQNI